MAGEPGWWGGYVPSAVVRQAMAFGASQEPEELSAALDLVAALDPLERVVEIGCDKGGTLFCWRSVCEFVYGITLPDNGWATGGSGEPLDTHGASVRFGDSHDPESLGWLHRRLGRGRDGRPAQADVLVIDGDHMAAGVVADLAMYGPFVRPGGLILLHDINSAHDPRVQVPRVWAALRSQYATSEIDCGGPGWGIIHVREQDRFAAEEHSDG